ncbi:hypothetical protein ARMSODRAFT_592580 [Armillaria solidipes]|uniref:Uncharacterized protein n=1 Tax=Armillaria solidipes TaxID=1076256 RepID=A0A2H3C5G2_9AGAR|nr:hypothetical protein ARMSODRAFT_592580 [Armillaria solidipes]
MPTPSCFVSATKSFTTCFIFRSRASCEFYCGGDLFTPFIPPTWGLPSWVNVGTSWFHETDIQMRVFSHYIRNTTLDVVTGRSSPVLEAYRVRCETGSGTFQLAKASGCIESLGHLSGKSAHETSSQLHQRTFFEESCLLVNRSAYNVLLLREVIP